MTLYYNHASLTGEALHYAKIPDIFPGNSLPPPAFEGQLIAQGDNLFVASGSPLNWRIIKGNGSPQLPSNLVTYQISVDSPFPEIGTGKIWLRSITGEAWLLVNSVWKKLGTGSEGSSALAEAVDGSIRFLGITDDDYGFVILSPVGNLGATSFLVIPWEVDSDTAFGGVFTPEILLSCQPYFQYYGFSVRPTSWRSEEGGGFTNSFKIFAKFADQTLRQTNFNYNDRSRIIEILGVLE